MLITKETALKTALNGYVTQDPLSQSFTTQAMIHSLKRLAKVEILHERSANDIVAEYEGKRYTAIYNPFVCVYYVDDVYGELPNQHMCPVCGVRIP